MDEKRIVDYTKYRLKSEDELKRILNGVSKLQVLLCEKCYKNFSVDSEPECNELRSIIEGSGIVLSGCISIPFLCNNYLTEKILANLKPDQPVGVAACGIGIQFVAGRLNERRVFALADTLSQSGNSTSIAGYHGIALTEGKCAVCGECYLEMTGGICPVVNCAKSLLNGPCGGADSESKCEVNPEISCVWIEIYERLKKQKRNIGRIAEIRDYNVFPPDERKKIALINRAEREEGFYGGVYPEEKKEETAQLPVAPFPAPAKVFVFLSQHMGIPSIPLVRAGDMVRIGQKIAESAGFISSPIHSGISGKVISIEEKIHPVSQLLSPAIIIENDGLDTEDDSLLPLEGWESLANKDILEFLREKGLVGMGGAMFPTPVKLSPPKKIDTLIINGCECEPYLNADNRLMIEYPQEILKGVRIAQQVLCAKEVFFCIEDNKKDAIVSIKSHKGNYTDLNISELKTKYPQGAEGVLIKRVLNRNVPEGGLPFDVGAVVLNTGTLYALYKAVYKGLPLFERVVTVAGDDISVSGNFMMKLGTPFSDIAKHCLSKDNNIRGYDIRMGGPMMGVLQRDLESAVIKGTSGILFLRKSAVEASQSRECIKCGRCVEVCPAELYPHYYAYYGKKELWEKAKKYNVNKCVECGCCQYICSSKIDLLSYIKKAKRYVDNKT